MFKKFWKNIKFIRFMIYPILIGIVLLPFISDFLINCDFGLSIYVYFFILLSIVSQFIYLKYKKLL